MVVAAVRLAWDLNAQTPEDIYIVGTTVRGSDPDTGVLRLESLRWTIQKTPNITFVMCSAEKGFEVWLLHRNYRLEMLNPHAAENPVYSQTIVDWPISRLSTLEAIDAAEFIRTKSAEESRNWRMENRKRRVWFIDRNDFYKSSDTLSAPDRMKLTETRIWIDDILDEM